MQPSASSSAAALYQSLTERMLARVGDFLVGTVRDVLVLWHERQKSRRDRVPAAFAHMDVRMLRDIGSPEWMVERAAAEREQWRSVARYLGWPPTV